MRFGPDKWPDHEAGLISDYLFHLCALPYASENALSVIFEPKMVNIPYNHHFIIPRRLLPDLINI